MANITELEATWTRRMAEFEERLDTATASTMSKPSLMKLAEEFREFRETVCSMISLLQQQVQDCGRVVDSIDMKQRQKILLFHGIKDDSEVNLEQKILNILNYELDLPHICSDSLKRCHRLGPPTTDHFRTVLVHFHDHRIKAEVWKAKPKLRGSGVAVSEFLTKLRQSVYKKARKYFGMKNVWTFDGVIHIRVPGGGREKVVSEGELDGLVAKFPEAPSSLETATISDSESVVQLSSGRHEEQSKHAIQDDLKISKLAGKYQHYKSENIDEYFAAIGVPYMVRKMIGLSSPLMEVAVDGDEVTIKTTSMGGTVEKKFKIGVEFDDPMLSIDLKSITNIVNDNELVTESVTVDTGVKSGRHYLFTDDECVVTFTLENGATSGKRYFKRIQ